MRNCVRIVCVRLDPAGGEDLSDDVAFICRWTWQQSAFVRWSQVTPAEIGTLPQATSLFVLEYTDRTQDQADAAFVEIRKSSRSTPVLIVDHRQELRPEVMSKFQEEHERSSVVLATELTGHSAIRQALKDLNVRLPLPRVKLTPGPNDPSVARLIELIGEHCLQRVIEEYCPEAKTAYIEPVSGGWSGKLLCRLVVDKDSRCYFLKFFDRSKERKRELCAHRKAAQWLGGTTVKVAASAHTRGEELQFDAYSTKRVKAEGGLAFFGTAVARLRLTWVCADLGVESCRPREPRRSQAVRTRAASALGRLQGKDRELGGWRIPILAVRTITAIGDLDVYGPAICADWHDVRERVRNLLYRPLSEYPWLTEFRPVAMGYIHGDPNCRNCFFSPENARRLKLIDCGEFRKRWRLVSDLAIIERELKIVLLGTDPASKGYFDLDAGGLGGTQPHTWCEAEQASITKGLGYDVTDADRNVDLSIRRAYRLIALIRARAKEASGHFDRYGRHCFAALLYWTLDILKEPAVRRTKKLLALYSAAQILAKKFP